MRLLHTSDWHLGISLHRAPMLSDQEAFLAWLRDLAVDRAVDGILVCGDVYDRAIPPVEAVRVLEQALIDLSAVCPVVVISGNHDSPARLGFGGRLMEQSDVHLRAGVDDIDRPVRLTGSDGVTVLVYALPYLEPDIVRDRLDAGRSHAAVLEAAMHRVRTHLAGQRSTGDTPRAVVMAHAFIAGGAASDSERDVTVGGIADAPVSVFAGVDYVALGHLHGPQAVSAEPLARYSGTPLAYSFSEEAHEKSVTIIDLPPDGAVTLETVPTPVPRPLVTLTGTLADLLDDPRYEPARDAWVRVVLTDVVRPENAMDRLQRRFPGTLDLTFAASLPGGDHDQVIDPRTADPGTVIDGFIEHVTGAPADAALLDLASQSLERVRIRATERA
jgi:exonuclease SbcD